MIKKISLFFLIILFAFINSSYPQTEDAWLEPGEVIQIRIKYFQSQSRCEENQIYLKFGCAGLTGSVFPNWRDVVAESKKYRIGKHDKINTNEIITLDSDMVNTMMYSDCDYNVILQGEFTYGFPKAFAFGKDRAYVDELLKYDIEKLLEDKTAVVEIEIKNYKWGRTDYSAFVELSVVEEESE